MPHDDAHLGRHYRNLLRSLCHTTDALLESLDTLAQRLEQEQPPAPGQLQALRESIDLAREQYDAMKVSLDARLNADDLTL